VSDDDATGAEGDATATATDTAEAPTTEAAAPDAASAPGGEPVAALPAPGDAVREARRTRLILPIALPVGAAVMMAVLVLNISRIFLAVGSTGAIVLGVTLILLILIGAAGLSAAPRVRTSSIIMMASGVLIVVISAGLVAAPASVEKSSGGGGNGFVNPSGPATSSLEVDALPTLSFQAKQFTVKAGILQINYVSKGGSHTLTFDDAQHSSFLLQIPPAATGKVLLKPGTYTIYCTIPGHRAAGMQATLIAQ
jgi:plastocyanin